MVRKRSKSQKVVVLWGAPALPYSEANGRKGPYVDDGAELMDLLFELKKL